MDRKFLEEVLIRNARKRDVRTVTLPALGTTVGLFTQLTQDEKIRIGAAAGADEDAEARAMTGALKFLLVDDDHKPILRSFAEAAQFVSALDEDDLQVLFQALSEIAEAAGGAQLGDEAVEAGKAS